jgi:gamma-glutamylcyclotransferase (GGCT)/AIG2-like uncharacterized protein YtfP
MATEIYSLFVYGSLRSGFQHPAYAYISRYFTLAGTARVQGSLYDMGDFPAAVPTTEEAYIVGELYHVNNKAEFSWAIAQLDDYEGLFAEPGEPQLYKRETAIIHLNNQTVTAWIYWFNGDVSGRPRIESGDLLQYIRDKNKS